MADDLKKRGPADATHINVNETWEVVYWLQGIRCTAAELEEAVDTVGVLAKDVQIYIASHKPPLQTSNFRVRQKNNQTRLKRHKVAPQGLAVRPVPLSLPSFLSAYPQGCPFRSAYLRLPLLRFFERGGAVGQTAGCIYFAGCRRYMVA